MFNDNGVMKQVSMADINTYIQSQVSQPTVNNSQITITAGDVLTGGGTFTTNGGATSITLNYQDVSSQGSVNGSGNTFIQDVTLDNYGHVTGVGTATVTQGSSGGFVKQGVTAPAGDYVAFNATKNQYGWQIYSGEMLTMLSLQPVVCHCCLLHVIIVNHIRCLFLGP